MGRLDGNRRDLGALTPDDFESCLGQDFAVTIDGSDPVVFTLTTVDRRGLQPGYRPPFSLLFAGPPTPVRPQGIYHLEHPTMGPLDVFLVPVGADQAAVTYEAVFT